MRRTFAAVLHFGIAATLPVASAGQSLTETRDIVRMPELQERAEAIRAQQERAAGSAETAEQAARLAQIEGLMAVLPLLPPFGRQRPFDYILWPTGPSGLPR
ncbi:MAG: hypothetical protein AAGB05_15480 [Pseudomonadota bacterium]